MHFEFAKNDLKTESSRLPSDFVARISILELSNFRHSNIHGNLCLGEHN